jgi:integral membrane sensor domain MASE1/serine phosphatase RsbU (regulator of sigma subunit)
VGRAQLIDGPRARYVARLVVVAAVYVATGKLGLHLAFASRSVTAVWPPTGIALAALILGGYRMWPGVAVGALLTNVDTGVPAVTVLGITLGNTLEGLAGAYLLRRMGGFRPGLDRVRDVCALVAFGAVISTMVSASIGTSSLLIGDAIRIGDLPSTWRTWWLGDMGGDLIVAPVVLVAFAHWPFRRAPGRALEAGALALLLAGVTVVVFSQRTNLAYVVFPLLGWAALRFWQPGAAAGGLIVAAIAVTFTTHGKGPFALSGPDERLLLTQTLVAVAETTTLVLAAVTSERRRAEDSARELAATLQESLLPAALPIMPGLDCAAYFRPAGAGQRVGGDFYDVFERSDRHWALVLGDVAGKGARAAALTALARWTVRSAAVHEPLPSRILASLNDAVRRQHDETALCTAVYASFDLDGGAVTATVSAGGHPLPLVVRRDGRVEELGRPGTILGAYDDPSLEDDVTALRAGETIVFYTDGLTDAYAPENPAPHGALESALRSSAGRRPEEIIETIKSSLLPTWGRNPRDDIAILVLQPSESPA